MFHLSMQNQRDSDVLGPFLIRFLLPFCPPSYSLHHTTCSSCSCTTKEAVQAVSTCQVLFLLGIQLTPPFPLPYFYTVHLIQIYEVLLQSLESAHTGHYQSLLSKTKLWANFTTKTMMLKTHKFQFGISCDHMGMQAVPRLDKHSPQSRVFPFSKRAPYLL